MKTRIFTLISLAALPFVLFSCNKVTEFKDGMPAPEITIHASIPDSQIATKVAAVVPENGKGLDWNWEASDQIAVLSGDAASVFDIRPGFTGKNASFIGKQVSGKQFDILFPGTCATVADMEALPLADQQQDGVDNTAHLQYFALLSGVKAYETFEFSQSWAVSNGGSFKQNGVLRIKLTLPEETVVVNRITLKAGSPVFHNGNTAEALTDEISIGINGGTLGSDHTVTAWMTTPWFDDVLPAGTEITVSVAAGDFSWVRSFALEAEKTIKSGFVNNITLDGEGWASGGRYAEGSGTEEDPWIIKNAKQMGFIRDDIVPGELRYFRLASDVDMAGVEWAPLNNADPYDRLIYFDGAGHTINNLTIAGGAAYASFAGVLYGTIKDVTFNHASIVADANKSGVVAGYVGTSAALAPCKISDVVVKNSSITAAKSVGAFVGQVATNDAIIENCHVYNTEVVQTATSTSHAGGFVGYAQAESSFINCSTDATVTGTQFAGGFAGYIGKAHMEKCSASGEVLGTKDVGGFAGKSDVPALVSCWYDGPKVTATDNTKNCHAGGFIGYANKSGGTFTGCYVKDTEVTAAAGQRVGGFAGQADAGNSFTKCYVEHVDITGGNNSAGFVGVDYANAAEDGSGGISQCWVEGGSLTAAGNNIGGFVGYPEGASIINSYTTIAVVGGAYKNVGGFLGDCKDNVTIRYCYAAGDITGDAGPIGAFAGIVEGSDDKTHINYCIAWNNTLEFEGKITGGDLSDNYCGKEGTLAGKAAELGWDPEIWDFMAKLR